MLFLLCAAFLLLGSGQSNAIDNAVAALQHGDFASAEETLRAELKEHPNNVEALDVLGVVLDNEKKYPEADEIYRRALNIPRPSPGLLNNYGNHLVAEGRLKDAKPVFLKVVALNPSQVNAHVQLARIAVEAKSPAEALAHLDRLPADAQQNNEVAILRMEALYLLQRNRQADEILARISPETETDAHLCGAAGLALTFAKQYDKAAVLLARAVEQQPRNVDLLYGLASVDVELKHDEAAIELLARAAQLAPERADVELLLARTTADLGYFGDSIGAWNRYIKLVPQDDSAKRERGFAETALGVNAPSGMADLQWFLKKHPNDPLGHYEMGVAENATNPGDALAHFDRAIALKPDFVAARLARAILNYRQAKPAAALSDLEFAAEREPQNASVLDRLGQTYLALNRAMEAVRILRKASELTPRDATILMHLGRALLRAGQKEEASAVMARFRELGPSRSVAHPAGLVEFLGLSPEEQYARYRTGVERTVRSHPENAEAQAEYLKICLAEKNFEQAAAVTRQLIALKPSNVVLANAAETLLNAEQYALAKQFLEDASSFAEMSGDLRLDLAIATSHSVNAQVALEQMDRIPEAERTGDYYLARAQMLHASGKPAEALAAVNQALRRSPTRPDLYRGVASLLIKNHRLPEAVELLDRGARILPDNPEIQFLRATALDLAGKTEDAQRLDSH
ncbi:MAG: tetratricopeptide repeat protein [Acidobacteriaceae bacterium]|nr:tetratricopeptide repeat protein [Acidobacteriaceae bacterium]MBV9779890.1 tetratricopeptide repeat protein [Acidobacteriaceae bacterium]